MRTFFSNAGEEAENGGVISLLQLFEGKGDGTVGTCKEEGSNSGFLSVKALVFVFFLSSLKRKKSFLTTKDMRVEHDEGRLEEKP